MREFYEKLEKADSNRDYRFATVVEGEQIGEKMLLEDGRISYCNSSFLPLFQNEIIHQTTTGIISADNEKIYVELCGCEKKMVICGAGHVSMPITKIAKMVGFTVTVIDDRKEYTEKAKEAGADHVICKPFAEALADIQGDLHTYFVIVTRAHQHDTACLKMILKKPYAYVGMMGSSHRVGIVKEKLIEEGYPEEAVNAIYTPIGLKIKAESAEEIAISVLAEVIEIKNRNRDIRMPRNILDSILGSHHKEPLRGRRMLCTIVEKHGSAPREVGTRMLYNEFGESVGTVGGGLTEALVKEKAQELLENNEIKAYMMHAILSVEDSTKEGEVCGGTVDIFLEEV